MSTQQDSVIKVLESLQKDIKALSDSASKYRDALSESEKKHKEKVAMIETFFSSPEFLELKKSIGKLRKKIGSKLD